MPYWDITYDAQFLNPDQPSATPQDQLPIFNSLLGGDGNSDNNHCVEDEPWNTDKYTTEFLCAATEQAPNCCLKRQRNTIYSARSLPNRTQITGTFELHRFREFQNAISNYHGRVHKFFAMSNESHMWANNAAEDPLFTLLHSFLDYVRMMRTDCLEYDLVANDRLEEYIPLAFDGYVLDNFYDVAVKPKLDTEMEFVHICEIESAFCNGNDVTPRDLYDISVNTRWGVSYELGSFWNGNHRLQAMCGDRLNATWFYNVDDDGNGGNHTVIDAVTEGVRKGYGWPIMLAILYALVLLVVMVCFSYVIVRQYVNYLRGERDCVDVDVKRKLVDTKGDGNRSVGGYGTV